MEKIQENSQEKVQEKILLEKTQQDKTLIDEKPLTTMEVKLLGQKIVLKCTESDPEVIRQIIQLVSIRLSEAEVRGQGSPPHHVALLALLDLAEEMIKIRKKSFDFRSQLDEKSSKLLSLVEADF